jgi:prefoldin subunit 5
MDTLNNALRELLQEIRQVRQNLEGVASTQEELLHYINQSKTQHAGDQNHQSKR